LRVEILGEEVACPSYMFESSTLAVEAGDVHDVCAGTDVDWGFWVVGIVWRRRVESECFSAGFAVDAEEGGDDGAADHVGVSGGVFPD